MELATSPCSAQNSLRCWLAHRYYPFLVARHDKLERQIGVADGSRYQADPGTAASKTWGAEPAVG